MPCAAHLLFLCMHTMYHVFEFEKLDWIDLEKNCFKLCINAATKSIFHAWNDKDVEDRKLYFNNIFIKTFGNVVMYT